MSQDERNYLNEARQILPGTTLLLPQREHLESLEAHHTSEIIRIVYELDKITYNEMRRI